MTTAADTLLGHLQAIKERWKPDEPDRFGIVTVGGPEAQGYVELLAHLDSQIDLARALTNVASRVVDLPHPGWVPLTITLDEDEYQVEFALEGIDGPIRLRFPDGSERALPIPAEPIELSGQAAGSSSASGTLIIIESTDATIVALDRGPALLDACPKPLVRDNVRPMCRECSSPSSLSEPSVSL